MRFSDGSSDVFASDRHVTIMYRTWQAPHFAGVKLHDEGAERLLADISHDWQRAERLGYELRHLPAAPDLAAEAGRAEAAPAAPSLDAARGLLGLGGRVTPEGGGMLPVDLELPGQTGQTPTLPDAAPRPPPPA